MADRQDIDALLIDALYGELENGDRERLEAHLVNHPRDRADLEDMRATRGMLRDAQAAVAFGAAEPPPAISARLLQEAARRAPAPREAGGMLGWFNTLLRPFLLHN
jgi:anti-sigma factor RsiW